MDLSWLQQVSLGWTLLALQLAAFLWQLWATWRIRKLLRDVRARRTAFMAEIERHLARLRAFVGVAEVLHASPAEPTTTRSGEPTLH